MVVGRQWNIPGPPSPSLLAWKQLGREEPWPRDPDPGVLYAIYQMSKLSMSPSKED
jgi:hypothetical protein